MLIPLPRGRCFHFWSSGTFSVGSAPFSAFQASWCGKSKIQLSGARASPTIKSPHIFYDAVALLGIPGVNQTQKPVRVVGYTVENTKYWVATSRHELTAKQIAHIYKLRWDIEIFFGWWKRHLRVYHLIASVSLL